MHMAELVVRDEIGYSEYSSALETPNCPNTSCVWDEDAPTSVECENNVEVSQNRYEHVTQVLALGTCLVCGLIGWMVVWTLILQMSMSQPVVSSGDAVAYCPKDGSVSCVAGDHMVFGHFLIDGVLCTVKCVRGNDTIIAYPENAVSPLGITTVSNTTLVSYSCPRGLQEHVATCATGVTQCSSGVPRGILTLLCIDG